MKAPATTDVLALAWYGKLPGAGDFVHRRMPAPLMQCWDAWLQRELDGLRARHADWVQHYLTAPIWGLGLASGVVDEHAWLGAMMPSVDRVGRYFPLAVFTGPLLDQDAWCMAPLWWQQVQRVMLQALDAGADGPSFDRQLVLAFAAEEGDVPAEAAPATWAQDWPDLGHSVWHPLDGAALDMLCEGLPQGVDFERLFDVQPRGDVQGVSA